MSDDAQHFDSMIFKSRLQGAKPLIASTLGAMPINTKSVSARLLNANRPGADFLIAKKKNIKTAQSQFLRSAATIIAVVCLSTLAMSCFRGVTSKVTDAKKRIALFVSDDNAQWKLASADFLLSDSAKKADNIDVREWSTKGASELSAMLGALGSETAAAIFLAPPAKAASAIAKLKHRNPALFVASVDPENRDLGLESVSDIVVYKDVEERAYLVAYEAKKLGAMCLVRISRAPEASELVREALIMKNSCSLLGLEWINVIIPAGKDDTDASVRGALEKALTQWGRTCAIYSPKDVISQDTISTIFDAHGIIAGIGSIPDIATYIEALNINVAKAKTYKDRVKLVEKAVAKAGMRGRVMIWRGDFRGALIGALVDLGGQAKPGVGGKELLGLLQGSLSSAAPEMAWLATYKRDSATEISSFNSFTIRLEEYCLGRGYLQTALAQVPLSVLISK